LASTEQKPVAPGELLRRRVGKGLILAGVAVWAVWLAVRLGGGDPEVGHYLPFHLAGVIPGALIARWDWLVRRLRRG
jgi:hypothetical protein